MFWLNDRIGASRTHMSVLPLVCLILPGVLLGSVARSDETQTDWSGGPDLPGPVGQWDDRFDSADNLAWRAIPGQLALTALPLDQAQQTVIAPDADHPRRVAYGDLDVLACAYYGIIEPPPPPPEARNGRYAWFENLNGQGDSWEQRTVADDYESAFEIHAADLDGDQDLDVIATQYAQFSWWKNVNGSGLQWDVSVVGVLPTGYMVEFYGHQLCLV